METFWTKNWPERAGVSDSPGNVNYPCCEEEKHHWSRESMDKCQAQGHLCVNEGPCFWNVKLEHHLMLLNMKKKAYW